MRQRILDPYSPPLTINTGQGGSPIHGINLGFLQVTESASTRNSKGRDIKRHTASLQRIATDSVPKSMKYSDRNSSGLQASPLVDKFRKRPNYKNYEISMHNRNNSKYSCGGTNDGGLSSGNNSIVFDTTKSMIKDKKLQTRTDFSTKVGFNKDQLLSQGKSHAASNYLLITPQQKIEDYKEKISNLQERMVKLIADGAWSKQLSLQLQAHFTQTKFTLDKAYAKLVSSPETEQEFLATLFQKELSFVRLIKLIKSEIFNLSSLNGDLNQKLQAALEENKIQKTRYQEERIKSSEEQDGNSSELKNLLQNTLKKTERNERIWTVEKQQMIAQIEKLSKEVEELRSTNNYLDLKEQYDSFQNLVYAKIRNLENEIEEKDVKIMKLENMYSRSNVSYKDLQKDHKELTKKYDDLLEQYNSHKSEFEKSINAQSRYREIALMSKEDLLHYRSRYENLMEELHKAQKKYTDTQYKLDRMKREQNELAIVNEEEFEKDSSLLSVIKEVFFNTKRPPIGTKLSNSTMSNESNVQDNVILEKFSFNKPTFFVFIQQEMEAEFAKLQQQQAQQQQEDKNSIIDRESLALIRAIFDSKYNELVYYDDSRLHSPFPDFVCSWLTSFYVCPNEKRIKPANSDNIANIQARRKNFYKFLLNPKMNKIWDVVVFRDFLEEKCAPDEVFFYLNCRYILFQGNQLSYSSSCMNPIQWVQFDKVERLIELILKKLGQEEYNTLKYKLKERAKKKASKLFIDAGLVLRVLLEFYRNEKKIKVVMLQEALNQVSITGKNNKPHVTFDVFKQFLEINYPFATELEKARLYREAWHVGNGKVDHESFFIAATEANFFTGSLKSSMFPKVPALDSYSPNREDFDILDRMSELIRNKYKEFFDLFEKSRAFARTLGVESILSSITTLESNLTKRLSSTYDETKGQGLYILFNQLIQTFIKIRNQYFLAYRNFAFNENQLAVEDMTGLQAIIGTINHYALLDQADQMEKNNKARKLQLYFRRKKNGWRGLVATLLNKVRTKEGV